MNFEATVYCCEALEQELKAGTTVRAERMRTQACRTVPRWLPLLPFSSDPIPRGRSHSLSGSVFSSIKAIRTVPPDMSNRQPDP